MLIYISSLTISFIVYASSLVSSDYPFTKKHFPDGVSLNCKQVVLSEKKDPSPMYRYTAAIDCENVKIKISLLYYNRFEIGYSSFPFAFSFPHSSHEGFTIEEVKINLPYMYYKFDNFSLTGANLFFNRYTCRRFNLETGVDELLFSGRW
jgi:hypothetical protein